MRPMSALKLVQEQRQGFEAPLALHVHLGHMQARSLSGNLDLAHQNLFIFVPGPTAQPPATASKGA